MLKSCYINKEYDDLFSLFWIEKELGGGWSEQSAFILC